MAIPHAPEPTSALFATAQRAASDNTDATESEEISYISGGAEPTTPTNSFWEVAEAKTLSPNWNKLFPYQLVIMKRENGKWAPAKSPEPFTLPIAPQSLTIDMAFAMQVEATQGGIVEQSNGSPFRDIVLQGTTGVLPLRNTTEKPSEFNVAGGIFAGTVAATSVLTQQLAQSLNLGALNNVIDEKKFDAGQSEGRGTGFYQFLLLKRFLEWYSNAKKTAAGANLALGFAVWKEEEIYLVTPSKFTVSRSAQSALAYNYTIAMRAWKRVTVKGAMAGVQVPHVFPGRDANKYAQVLNGIDSARRALENGRNVLSAIRADVNNAVFGNLRTLSLFIKDVLGTGLAAADLPYGLYSDFRNGLLEAPAIWASIKQAVDAKPETIQLAKDLESLAGSSQKVKTRAGSPEPGQGGPVEIKESGNYYNGKKAPPAHRIFTNPTEFYDFWSRVKIDQLNLRPETVRNVNIERASGRNLRREDFERMSKDIGSVLADFEAAVGVGNAAFTNVFGTSNRTSVRTEPSDGDWDIIFALGESMRQLDAMAASSSINRIQNNTPSDFVAGLAQRSGIAFTVPASKFLVPFPHEYTLEQLSAKYLGTPDRWMEIATLNGLSSPYVDEIGFEVDFLTNGSGNKFGVADSLRHYVGQPVWLSAVGIPRQKRHIIKIEVLSTTLCIVTVDGEADLNQFTVALQSKIQAYLPQTVNSLQFIYIPSSSPVETDWLTKSIPGIDSFDPLFRVGGADLLVDTNGDLVISRDGTTRLAVGLTNLIQRLRIGVATPQGSLARHPEFGFGVIPGTSTSDISAKAVLAAAKAFVANESGFAGVTYAAVQKNGNGMTISLAVEIAGTGKTVPITVDLK